MATQGLAGCNEIAAAKHNLATAEEWAAAAEKFAQHAMKKVEEERKYLQSVEEKWKVIDVDKEDDQPKKKGHFCGDQVVDQPKQKRQKPIKMTNIKLVGTLSSSDCDNLRQHIIQGIWKHGMMTQASQGFQLTLAIPSEEALEDLPKDGEYCGCFRLNGNTIPERAKLMFMSNGDNKEIYAVQGMGCNQFGRFKLSGTVSKRYFLSSGGRKTHRVSMHKKYY